MRISGEALLRESYRVGTLPCLGRWEEREVKEGKKVHAKACGKREQSDVTRGTGSR